MVAFESLGEELNNKEVKYKLHQPLWRQYDLSVIDFQIDNWTTIKFLNDNADDLSNEAKEVLPNNSGGLYLFSIKCSLIPGMTEYPVYIGKASLTENQNLKNRCRDYYYKYKRNDPNERPLIKKMFNYWRNELYLSFIKIDDNNKIKEYEEKLINSLLLPFNSKIPDINISKAIKAFRS